MSKRQSLSQSTQSNTLLNYFQSPKAKANGNNLGNKKQNGSEKNENVANGTKEDSPVHANKRRKIAIIDSDSEEESISKHTPNKKNGAKRPPDDCSDSSSDSEEKNTDTKQKLKKFAADKCSQESSSSSVDSAAAPSKPPPVAADVNWLHNRLDFLQPEKIRDFNRRRPTEPDYDPRTLHIPDSFLSKQTPAMRQWWVLKSTHMDTVLFFKVGKFYELYHMDAVVGVNHLGFSYMKGEFAHSGFPEIAYNKMATALIEKGFKVARTEQTETPEMMAERCKKQKKTTKFDKVVKREICQITTKATCVYSAQLPDAMHAESCYLYAIAEKDANQQGRVGICFIDTSIGVFHMAEFDDDKESSKLLTCLSEYPPGLILTERKKLSSKLQVLLNTHYGEVRKETLAVESQFYSATKTIETLINGDYFRDKNNELHLPSFIANIADGYTAKPDFKLTVASLGACLWYLRDSQLDIQVVSMGKFKFYDPLNLQDDEGSQRNSMILDATTIQNLNLLGKSDSLQRVVDHCQTAFGKRLLQQWICRPLCNATQIRERQEAIQELCTKPSLLEDVQTLLKKMPDLERQLAKLHSYGNLRFAQNHPDSRAVFYEATSYTKRRVVDLLRTLKGFETAQLILPLFQSDVTSPLLKRLTHVSPEGMYVDLDEPLQFFKGAFDQEEAKEVGKIIPKAGVDSNYDLAEKGIEEVKGQLSEYLEELRKSFGHKVTYFGSDKKRFQIDIPESCTSKVPSEFQLEGAKKGSKGKASKRYSTPRSRELLAAMMRAEAERAKVLQDINRRIFEKFGKWASEWQQAIDCISYLDVLCSMARYANRFSYDICIPTIEPIESSNKVVIKDGRHPCLTNIQDYVPNDTKLGVVGHGNILLLSGPNMGGKSTLMRQIAIICIMAHMGGYVPASSCTLNLIDRIFTRLGAHDDIVQGQSTFLLELSEASTILKHASSNSLVLLDELGRGTSTHDGNAIATAYVEKLTKINCRSLFSTHYHSLIDQFEDRSGDDIQLGHMACMVKNDGDPTEEAVTFLYKIIKGRCPKSYGFNVAKLAGLKHCIVSRGREVASGLEREAKNRRDFRKLFASLSIDNVKLVSSMSSQ